MRNLFPSKSLAFFFAAILLSSVYTTGLADSFDETIDWETASPSEIHGQMGKLKAERLEQSRLMQKTFGTEKALSAQTDYDVTFYDIALDIDHVAQALAGTVGIHGEAVTAGLTEVPVDFASTLTIDSIWTLSGPLTYSRAGDVVTVNLPAAINVGESFSFFFTYHGVPVGGGFQGFDFSTWGGTPVISSLSEPYYARSWWP